MLTNALRPSSNFKLCTPPSVTQKSTSSPCSLHDHSSSFHACVTFVLSDVLSSTRSKPLCSSPIVFMPMDPDVAADSPGGCIGHGPVLALGSPAARRRKRRRLRQEGAVEVAIMISDTRGLQHADMIRSAAARPRGAKCATSVLGLALTRWRFASTVAGKNEALGSHLLECRRLQARYSLSLSAFVEHFCLATAALLSLVHGIMDPRALLNILEPCEVELPPVEDVAPTRLLSVVCGRPRLH